MPGTHLMGTYKWMVTKSLKSNRNLLRQNKITKNQEMGRELNRKNSQSESKAVPPKVMLGVPKGNTGFKHLITPTAETCSPSAYTKEGSTRQVLSSMSISSSSSSPLPPNYSTPPTSAEAQPQGCRS